MKHITWFLMLLTSTATVASAAGTQFNAKLKCVSRCETRHGEADDYCVTGASFEVVLAESTPTRGLVTVGGWEGEQLSEETFKVSELSALLSGRAATAQGLETAGFSHGLDYVSTWDIICSLK